MPKEQAPSAHQPQEPAAFYSKSALNAVEDMIAFGAGAGTESLHGSLDNTAIFALIRANL
jgi:alkaline phosphatase